MSASDRYRTLFLGTLVQESFLTLGGTDDLFAPVDSPFCRDGLGRPTLRGHSLAGALIATLRRLCPTVPEEISGSIDGRVPSVWRFFHSHPPARTAMAFRQHVAIDDRTAAAADSALFDVETMPPGTRWPFLLEVETRRFPDGADRARAALSHWAAGRCLLGGEVARGLGWMRLADLREYTLSPDQAASWPNAQEAADYPSYVTRQFGQGRAVPPAEEQLPGWTEYAYSLTVGPRDDEYGIDSISVGGHASEELAAQWDDRFLDRHDSLWTKESFDPDFAVVTLEQGDGKRHPFVPGSSLRGPLRHALARQHGKQSSLVLSLFGTTEQSAKLLIRDALPDNETGIRMAWMQHHAEDEFVAGAYESAKFDRIAVMQGRFTFRMVLEDASEAERQAFEDLLQLAHAGQIGIGGGQWRGHGWPSWKQESL